VDDGAETLYNADLDKWFLNNQMHFENYKMHRGVCRLYAILIYEDRDVSEIKFRIHSTTGFVMKIGNLKYVASTLSTI
jgi:hypothetical protein